MRTEEGGLTCGSFRRHISQKNASLHDLIHVFEARDRIYVLMDRSDPPALSTICTPWTIAQLAVEITEQGGTP